MFKHIIISRFNVRSNDLKIDEQQTRSGGALLTPEWMEHRIDLFEKYFLSSLQQQTCRNFLCWVFFNEDTAPQYKAVITELQKKYPCFEPVYIKDGSFFFTVINQKISALAGPDTKYIITSRLDNDDAYHSEAVEYIQKWFVPEDQLGLNLTKGYRLVQGEKQLLLKNTFENGPFLSFIEEYKPGQPLQTIYCFAHNKFLLQYKVKQIRAKYLWLQNIHDFNVSNDISGLPTLDKTILKEFGLEPSGFQLSLNGSVQQAVKYILDIRNYLPFKLKYAFTVIKNKILQKEVSA